MWAAIAVLIVSVLIQYALQPKPPQPPSAELKDIDAPTADEGRPVPVVFGTALVTVNVTESTAYGAALLAGVGTRTYASVPEACDATIRIVDRTEPIPENQSAYNEYYPVYRSLYRALKPAFDAVAAIE